MIKKNETDLIFESYFNEVLDLKAAGKIGIGAMTGGPIGAVGAAAGEMIDSYGDDDNEDDDNEDDDNEEESDFADEPDGPSEHDQATVQMFQKIVMIPGFTGSKNISDYTGHEMEMLINAYKNQIPKTYKPAPTDKNYSGTTGGAAKGRWEKDYPSRIPSQPGENFGPDYSYSAGENEEGDSCDPIKSYREYEEDQEELASGASYDDIVKKVGKIKQSLDRVTGFMPNDLSGIEYGKILKDLNNINQQALTLKFNNPG